VNQSIDEWVTAPEAARHKGVAESSVRRAIQEGRLPGLRKGRTYLVRRADLDSWCPIGHRPCRGATRLGPKPEAGHQFDGRDVSNEAAIELPRPSRAGAKRRPVDRGAARAARIAALRREFADLRISTEEFLREKHEDTEWEERREVG
jgi:excisionase family DNA binding protein